jgi:hypothetical protein
MLGGIGTAANGFLAGGLTGAASPMWQGPNSGSGEGRSGGGGFNWAGAFGG